MPAIISLKKKTTCDAGVAKPVKGRCINGTSINGAGLKIPSKYSKKC